MHLGIEGLAGQANGICSGGNGISFATRMSSRWESCILTTVYEGKDISPEWCHDAIRVMQLNESDMAIISLIIRRDLRRGPFGQTW